MIYKKPTQETNKTPLKGGEDPDIELFETVAINTADGKSVDIEQSIGFYNREQIARLQEIVDAFNSTSK